MNGLDMSKMTSLSTLWSHSPAPWYISTTARSTFRYDFDTEKLLTPCFYSSKLARSTLTFFKILSGLFNSLSSGITFILRFTSLLHKFAIPSSTTKYRYASAIRTVMTFPRPPLDPLFSIHPWSLHFQTSSALSTAAFLSSTVNPQPCPPPIFPSPIIALISSTYYNFPFFPHFSRSQNSAFSRHTCSLHFSVNCTGPLSPHFASPTPSPKLFYVIYCTYTNRFAKLNNPTRRYVFV